jgi:hypothetical protein
LVVAISKLTGAPTATITKKEKENGLFGGLKDMIEGLVHKILDGFEWLKDLKSLGAAKNFFSLLRFLASPIFAVLTNPAVLMVGSILGLAYLLKKYVETVTDMSKLTPEEAKNVLENGSPKDIEKFGGREKLMEIAIGGKEQAKRILAEQAELTPEERTQYEKIANIEVKEQTATQLRPVIPRDEYIKNSKKTKTAAAEFWDQNFGATHNPDGTPKVKMAAQSLPQGVEPATDQSRADAAATDPRRVDLPTGAATGVKPHGIPTVDDRLNKVMSENISANLPNKSTTATQNVVNNLVKNKTNQRQELAKLSEIAVHNDEPTFLRMIMGSTRIV